MNKPNRSLPERLQPTNDPTLRRRIHRVCWPDSAKIGYFTIAAAPAITPLDLGDPQTWGAPVLTEMLDPVVATQLLQTPDQQTSI